MFAFLPFLFFGLVNAQIPSLNITIATLPTFSTCKPATINWSGGSGTFSSYFRFHVHIELDQVKLIISTV